MNSCLHCSHDFTVYEDEDVQAAFLFFLNQIVALTCPSCAVMDTAVSPVSALPDKLAL